ncbi:MAG: hypothetical protein WBN30_08930, partial [Polyangiales bacterium]
MTHDIRPPFVPVRSVLMNFGLLVMRLRVNPCRRSYSTVTSALPAGVRSWAQRSDHRGRKST